MACVFSPDGGGAVEILQDHGVGWQGCTTTVLTVVEMYVLRLYIRFTFCRRPISQVKTFFFYYSVISLITHSFGIPCCAGSRLWWFRTQSARSAALPGNSNVHTLNVTRIWEITVMCDKHKKVFNTKTHIGVHQGRTASTTLNYARLDTFYALVFQSHAVL